ncbi:hypothetical protein ACWEFL_17015 [Streptomyces sp. NPDC004838]
MGGTWVPVISAEKTDSAPSTAQPGKTEESAQQPSASGDSAQAGHHLPGADFGAIAFDFDGGLPDAPLADAGADGAAAPDGDAGAGGFESFAAVAPPETMA